MAVVYPYYIIETLALFAHVVDSLNAARRFEYDNPTSNEISTPERGRKSH